MNKLRLKRIFAIVAIVSFVLFSFSGIVVHSHCCFESDCTVCALGNLYRNAVGALALIGTICFIINYLTVFVKNNVSQIDINTLVEWKVKLSN